MTVQDTLKVSRLMTNQRFVLIVLCIVGALCLFFFGACIQQEMRLNELRKRKNDLDAQYEQLRLTAVAYENDIAFGQTDAYIERVAREELGYVKHGEIKFVAGDASSIPQTPIAPNASPTPSTTATQEATGTPPAPTDKPTDEPDTTAAPQE